MEWIRIVFTSILFIAFLYGTWVIAAQLMNGISRDRLDDDRDGDQDSTVTGWHFIERIINRPEYFKFDFTMTSSEGDWFSGLDFDQVCGDGLSCSSTCIEQTYNEGLESSGDVVGGCGAQHLDEVLNPKVAMPAVVAQVDRVAKARSLTKQQVEALVLEFTEGPLWGVFGEPLVDLFRLNLALDQIWANE